VLLAAARGQGWFWLEAVVNLVDVRDVAEAHFAAAEKGRLGQRYILGGHNLSVRQAIETLAGIAHVPPPRFRVPLELLDVAAWLGDRLPGLSLLGNHLRAVRHWQGYDTRKAREELGLRPRPLEESLRDMLKGYVERGWLSADRSVVG
jgi:dihydroflavonol-4-reductase